MNWIKSKGPFVILIFLALWILFFSLWDILAEKGWMNPILAAYTLLIILTIVFIIFRSLKPFDIEETVEEFEKRLKGGLFHYKCPSCYGFFAIKKSTQNNDKNVRMNCPDCGTLGVIPSHSTMKIEVELPEKKSISIAFKCNSCGEGVTVWAEGSDLHPGLDVHSCPFCGNEKTMVKS